ncbi:hypothetical protein BM221_008280 [Beauveria bassiana]|uniref:Uncharacterized protein n=1 Tax=Beauveria bassiana TaxID=176275 RepID=A0A2N6NFM1_BEABA|nr:hypothetical protein BM221_008280 [Beauveria bassiana]
MSQPAFTRGRLPAAAAATPTSTSIPTSISTTHLPLLPALDDGLRLLRPLVASTPSNTTSPRPPRTIRVLITPFLTNLNPCSTFTLQDLTRHSL